MRETITITVIGKVQGVFFRQSAREKAISLGITGFVQNRADKTVFITATGRREQLEALLAWCQEGPPRAQVSGMSTKPAILQSFDGFHIKRTDAD